MRTPFELKPPAGHCCPNRSAVLWREGAGYAAFYQIEQQLPINGRRGFLKQAGASAVGVTEAESAALLWSLRSDARLAFYRLLADQRRETVLGDGLRDLEEVIRVLRAREQEGEGSRYDRLRAERELAEYRSQLSIARTDIAAARAALSGFLPPATRVDRVAGNLETDRDRPRTRFAAPARALPPFGVSRRTTPDRAIPARGTRRRAFALSGTRGDRRCQAWRCGSWNPRDGFGHRDHCPNPILQQRSDRGRTLAGGTGPSSRAAKRAGTGGSGRKCTGAAEALQLRKTAIAQYRSEVNALGADLSRITRLAYQEGEVGILELLDSYRVTRQSLLRLLELEALAKEAQIELDRAVGEEVLP